MEQYDVTGAVAGGGGGEYPLQHGFGWTNGVLRKLLRARPRADDEAEPIDVLDLDGLVELKPKRAKWPATSADRPAEAGV